jgi:NTE family protein
MDDVDSGSAASRTTGAGWRPERCQRVALVLQGGGALGAYQAGVYQALHEAGIEPDWVSGVSIGAINAALIAGNPAERRVERLRQFWQRITDRPIWPYTPDGDFFRQAFNAASAWLTTAAGQPGFFTPHLPGPWFSPAGSRTATSYYDNTPLQDTLAELVDFRLINRRHLRFSVGAVNILSGNFHYFDNKDEEIEAAHVMASGALPPALPMVKVGTDHYWDGGIVSNTPLQHLLDHDDGRNALVFQVDLFNARGQLPRDIQDVMGRHKDIMYSSRTRYTTDVYRQLLYWKKRLHEALAKIPDADLSDEQRHLKGLVADLPEMTILHLIYQRKAYEGHAKDYEFSAASMHEHWRSGYDDTQRTLKRRDWLVIPPDGAGIVVHDVHRDHDR